MESYALWLTSWYPTILSPYDGDFIQRHAKAVSLQQKVVIVYVKKDDEGIITKKNKIVRTSLLRRITSNKSRRITAKKAFIAEPPFHLQSK